MPASYHDAHLHLMALAASRLSIDCSVAVAPSIEALLRRLAEAVGTGTPSTGWLRAWGYDDALIAERRHPSRTELDDAVGDHPLVLHHVTGHAAVLNRAALVALGEDLDAHPTGLLVDAHDVLARVPPLPERAVESALATVSAELAGHGIGAFTDATHTNDRAALERASRAVRAGHVEQAVTMMAGWDRLSGLRYGERVGDVTVGHAKIMPGTGPAPGRLGHAVASAAQAGFPSAIHVMDIDVLAATIDAIRAVPPPPGTRHRIEHCAMALPEQVERLAELAVEVVTQPSFILHRATKYREQLSPVELEWLWPLRSLVDAGVTVRFSSDAPVVPARPEEWLAGATSRTIAPTEAISEAVARRLLSSAYEVDAPGG